MHVQRSIIDIGLGFLTMDHAANIIAMHMAMFIISAMLMARRAFIFTSWCGHTMKAMILDGADVVFTRAYALFKTTFGTHRLMHVMTFSTPELGTGITSMVAVRIVRTHHRVTSSKVKESAGVARMTILTFLGFISLVM